jgi:YbbR domain-containing protein
VEVRNVSENYLVTSELPEFVQLVLRGRDEALSLINEGDLVAYIDLEMNSAGEAKKIVKIERRGIPRGVSIKEIDPRIIDVSLDPAIRKNVKVIPIIMADLPDGYSFEDIIIEPSLVEIQGPASLINEVESVYTKEVNFRNLTETTVMEVELETGSDKITLINNEPVSVKILIREEFVIKRVSSVTVYPVNVAEGLIPDLGEQQVSVLFKLPKRFEPAFRDDQVYVYVDCTDISETGDYPLPVSFQSDIAGASLVRVDPPTVRVRMGEVPEEETKEE